MKNSWMKSLRSLLSKSSSTHEADSIHCKATSNPNGAFLETEFNQSRTAHLSCATVCLGILLAAQATPVLAVTFEHGQIEGAFDSTFSIGGQWRIDDPDPRLISKANGGTNGQSVTQLTGAPGNGSSNTDDGNLNYNSGLVAATLKGTHELSLTYGQFGAFIRGTYFYDPYNHDEALDRIANLSDLSTDTRLSSLYGALTALQSAGLLDTSRFPAGTLSSNSAYELSEDAERAVSRGADLLDAFISTSWEYKDHYFDMRIGKQVVSWGESTFIQNSINAINPVNVPALRLPGAELREGLLPVSMVWLSFDITNNVSFESFYQLDWQQTRVDEPGTYFATNDFVGLGGQLATISGLDECTDNALACSFPNTITRGPDRTPGDTGQFGFALRWFAESLNNTEFGFYALNYHSRRPIISATAGSYDDTVFATSFLGALNFLTTAGIPLTQAGAPSLIAAQNNSLIDGTGQYFIEYPEDIQLIGTSFNTSIDRSGIALAGEISLRTNAPIQIDDQELLQAALSSADPLITSTLGTIGIPSTTAAAFTQGQHSQYNQSFGDPTEGQYIRGYLEKEVIQTQMTASKIFGPQLGASQWILIGEVGATHINLPEKELLLTDGPGTGDDGQQTNQQGFGDDFSWGYRVRARFDYNNVFHGWNLKTTYSVAHDVNGTTPLPIANFLEDRKAFELSMAFDRQSVYGVGLTYATFWGGAERNLIQDRDFIALTLNASI